MSTTEQILHVESLLRKACLLSIAPRYHRAYSEERQRTYLGVICSALSIAFVIYAGFLEVAFYRSVETVTEAEVEDSLHGIFQLYVNITFPFEKCSSIDVVWSDLHGARLPWPNDSLERAIKVKSVWLNESVWTNQASQKKTECGSCYGAETDQKPCCNTCSEVILGYIHRGWSIPDRETFAQCVTAPLDESHTRQDSSTEKRIEGCNLEVTTMINRLSGKLEFLPHMNPFLFFATNLQSINPDHIIHAMYFGETSVARTLPSPLNGRKAIRPNQSTDKMLYNYFVTIVPTILRGINGTEVEGFQYSTWSHSHTSQETTETIELIQEEEMQENVHSKSTAATSGNSTAVAVVDVAKRALQRRIIEANSPTGLYISYDTSPLILHLRQRRPFRSGIHFILNIFSVVGGIFTTVALVDSFLYRSIETIKERLGKQA